MVRRIFSRRIKPVYTWVVMVALMVAGYVVPLVISFFLSFRGWNYDNNYLWLLTNPFTAVHELSRFPPRMWYVWPFVIFAGYWAGIVTLLNLRWFGRQVKKFRPYAGDGSPAYSSEPPKVLTASPAAVATTFGEE